MPDRYSKYVLQQQDSRPTIQPFPGVLETFSLVLVGVENEIIRNKNVQNHFLGWKNNSTGDPLLDTPTLPRTYYHEPTRKQWPLLKLPNRNTYGGAGAHIYLQRLRFNIYTERGNYY